MMYIKVQRHYPSNLTNGENEALKRLSAESYAMTPPSETRTWVTEV